MVAFLTGKQFVVSRMGGIDEAVWSPSLRFFHFIAYSLNDSSHFDVAPGVVLSVIASRFRGSGINTSQLWDE